MSTCILPSRPPAASFSNRIKSLFYCKRAKQAFLSSYFTQQVSAALQHVAPRRLKVAGVPRVGHVTGTGGMIQQKGQLAVGVAAADAAHVPQVGAIHAHEEVVGGVVLLCELAGGVAGAGDAVLGQLAPRRRLDWVADLLPAGGRRFDMKL